LISILEENDIRFEDGKTAMLQTRRAFDRNVGIERVIDLENDVQLQRAIEVINSGEIPEILAKATPELEK
jgi:hypothetical protein